jgi:hypothetical protein
VKLRLDADELRLLDWCGELRQAQAAPARARGCRDNYGYTGDPTAIHVLGATAEYAVARSLNLFWTPIDGRRGSYGDVCHLEVRGTTHPNGRLIVHDDDPDDRPYVLVRVLLPVCDVIGWAWGADCKRTEYWPGPYPERPAYYLPNEQLIGMTALPGEAF